MEPKLIVVLLAALGLTTSAAFAEPTGVSSTAPDVRTPAATAQADSRRMSMAETTLGGPSGQIRIASDGAAGVDSGRSESGPARTHRNSQHPAVLSHSHPVYPIGVPLPPVSLERY